MYAPILQLAKSVSISTVSDSAEADTGTIIPRLAHNVAAASIRDNYFNIFILHSATFVALIIFKIISYIVVCC